MAKIILFSSIILIFVKINNGLFEEKFIKIML